jgi:hypothetical protein
MGNEGQEAALLQQVSRPGQAAFGQNAAAKSDRGCSASRRSISRWISGSAEPTSASATGPSPSSNSRLPREDCR